MGNRNNAKRRKRTTKGRRRELTFGHRKTMTLADGTTGYAMLAGRGDDCFRAAMATTLQVPAGGVPDPDIDRLLLAGHDPETVNRMSWGRMVDWLQDRGLRIVYHDSPPVTCARWIGVHAESLSVAAFTVAEVWAAESRAEKRAFRRAASDTFLEGEAALL